MFPKIKGTFAINKNDNFDSIFSHPEIGHIWQDDFRRIDEALNYYKGRNRYTRETNSCNEIIERKLLSTNIMKAVCKKVATLLFNEECEITCSNDFVKEVLDKNNFKSQLSKYIEPFLASGGMVIKPYTDGGDIKLSISVGKSFIPLSHDNGEVTEAVFVSKSESNSRGQLTVYTLLEFHRWIDKQAGTYSIEKQLFKSPDKVALGERIPLDFLYPNMQELVVLNNLTTPLFVYIKPFGFNNFDLSSPFGLSICANSFDTIDRIENAYDELDQEIRLGRRRILVASDMLETFDERGNRKEFFNSEENVYKCIPGMGDDIKVTDLSSEIRTDQFKEAINYLLETLESELGFSKGMFSLGELPSRRTATEVIASNSASYMTRQGHANELIDGIKKLAVVICELGYVTGIYDGNNIEKDEIEVNLDDSLFMDIVTEANYFMSLVAAQLIPKKYAIKAILKVTDDEAQDILKEINEETTWQDEEAAKEEVTIASIGASLEQDVANDGLVQKNTADDNGAPQAVNSVATRGNAGVKGA